MTVRGLKIVSNQYGFSLTEMIIVVGIIGILLGIVTLAFQSLQTRYLVETEVKEMLTDMLNARARATVRNRMYFVTIASDSYQITEDSNESGGIAPDAGDVPLFATPKPLKYAVLAGGTGTIIMDAKGLVSDPANPGMCADSPHTIRVDAGGADSEYDCLLLATTRINVGKWNGANCVAK